MDRMVHLEFPWGAAPVAGTNRGAMAFDSQERKLLGIKEAET
jgi:hypothetical protein